MKRLMLCGLIAVASLVAATTLPRSHVSSINGTIGAARPGGMQAGVQADKLPVQDFDDRSLVFPRESMPR
ncbi:hypothetical protein [Bradyrhizobium liaoningense]|uniref:hypothetical protein n=1 Tax=Bradyrhizobium liaoningense TaxID=43992 RepID=UPI001BA7C16F|nr:hypothetical protein [Bradyrhizobium liaoningense]MBR0816677.1 hypothetical protein [Bradyrhizobium liaoningense]